MKDSEITKEGIQTADQTALLAMYDHIREWSERRKNDAVWQAQRALKTKELNEAQREMGRMNVLAKRIRTRLIHEFGMCSVLFRL